MLNIQVCFLFTRVNSTWIMPVCCAKIAHLIKKSSHQYNAVMDREKIQRLETLIKRHQNLYYNDKAELSDEEFDLLWDELKLSDPDNPLLKKIGKDDALDFKKAKHIMPMGSQEKASNVEDFLKWSRGQNTAFFIVQYKLDGASLELQYKDSKLIRAITRGDGVVGDDITENALKMKGVLKELKINCEGIKKSFTGAIRGEVLMPKDVFSSIYVDKANCRNAANGIMKRKDGKGCEHLMVICYDIWEEREKAQIEDFLYKDEMDKLNALSNFGLLVVDSKTANCAEDVISYRESVANKRRELPFDIDGLVVKSVELDIEDLKRVRPNKQIAFKFDLEKAISTIRAVEWSESGTTYTPIALIDEVSLAGTKVRRASLANPNIIKNLGLKIGSRVLVSKRGEIIPKIESLLENPLESTEIVFPTHCSACGTFLVNEGTRLYCPNIKCKGKALHKIKKWVDVLDLKEVGELLINRLFESGKVQKIKDLYTLNIKTLISMERMANLSSQKVYDSIHSKKEISIAQLIAGFDIEEIGITMAEKIESAGFNSLESLFSVKIEQLQAIDGMAEKLSSIFLTGLSECKEEMKELIESGFISLKERKMQDAPLKNMSFCFTGELNSMSRKDAEQLVKDRGGIVKSTVTKTLTYLVTNTPQSGSSKNKQANKLGIKIISEDEWLSLFK